MTNKQFERLVTNLQDIMRCPHCSSTYTMPDIHYLGQLENMTFLHMRCEECKTPVFASVALANQDGDIVDASLTSDDIDLTKTGALNDLDSYDPMADLAYGSAQQNLGFEHKQLDDLPSGSINSQASRQVEIPIQSAHEIAAEKVLSCLSPISYNQVLDAHEFLNNCSGDFEFLKT